MKTTRNVQAQELVRERIGRYVVLACPGSGAVQVVQRTDGSTLTLPFGAGPRKRPSPRGLSGGPG